MARISRRPPVADSLVSVHSFINRRKRGGGGEEGFKSKLIKLYAV